MATQSSTQKIFGDVMEVSILCRVCATAPKTYSYW